MVVALAAAVGGVLGWGGVRLCDSLVRTMEEEGARVVAVRERERKSEIGRPAGAVENFS